MFGDNVFTGLSLHSDQHRTEGGMGWLWRFPSLSKWPKRKVTSTWQNESLVTSPSYNSQQLALKVQARLWNRLPRQSIRKEEGETGLPTPDLGKGHGFRVKMWLNKLFIGHRSFGSPVLHLTKDPSPFEPETDGDELRTGSSLLTFFLKEKNTVEIRGALKSSIR